MSPSRAPVLDLEAALAVLDRGGVVAYPTETFYGIGARLDRPEAVSRVARIKGRDPLEAPLPVLVADLAIAGTLLAQGALPGPLARLADALWPGALTLVAAARPGLPPEVAADGAIGLRVSAHPIAAELVRRAGPLVATSANHAGEPAEACGDVVRVHLQGDVDGVLVYDEGVRGGQPSTVVGLTGEGELRIFRVGAITPGRLTAALGG